MALSLSEVLKPDELVVFVKINRARRMESGDLDRLCREFYDMRTARGLKRFELGKVYFRMDGVPVKIIATKDSTRGYECVVADDGTDESPEIHRYNRSIGGDMGRVTGTDHNFIDPRNLIAEAI